MSGSVIGGPSTNSLSMDLLQKLGLSWVFKKVDGKFTHLMRYPDDNEGLSIESDSSPYDLGFFLKANNPFSKKRETTVYAVMGLHSWGTQAAAALPCTARSAGELMLISKETDNNFPYLCAWVKIWGGDHSHENKPCNNENILQIVWPLAPKGRRWNTHFNDADIKECHATLEHVKDENSHPNLLPVRAIDLFASYIAIGFFAIIAFAIYSKDITLSHAVIYMALTLILILFLLIRIIKGDLYS